MPENVKTVSHVVGGAVAAGGVENSCHRRIAHMMHVSRQPKKETSEACACAWDVAVLGGGGDVGDSWEALRLCSLGG